jgi:predicted AlkP superfamily pyrophosphatase or phosphodiesterase
MRIFIFLLMVMGLWAEKRPVVVISVDGLDHRYLRDADKLGLKIPTLRKMMREGEFVGGLIGAVPTVTWPSHTTLITGVAPREHGILGNRRAARDTGDYYWMADMLKVRTLWHATRKAGLKSAAITWPVTVNADIDFNLPEYFRGRDGGSMDYISVFEKATVGLVEKIEKFDPSFRQQWVDDRTRKVATVYLLKQERPDLILLHFVDLDAVAHEAGPFEKEANHTLEVTDGYIAEIVKAAPKEAVIVVLGDHGFERVDRDLNLAVFAQGMQVEMLGGLLGTRDAKVAATLRASGKLGREVPLDEVKRFVPGAEVVAAFEPKRNEGFARKPGGELYVPPYEKGNHGWWPGLEDYRAGMVVWGKGVKRAKTPAVPMESVAARLAEILGVKLER